MHRYALFCLFALGLVALPLAAHHSFATVFDMNKPTTFTGTVTKVEWTNPHAWFYVDVKDEKGVVRNYACETGPPNVLSRNGWKKDSLKIGDTVNVSAYRAKDGTDTFSTRQVTMPDGRKVFAGSAADEGK
ncbi:MAG: DUF6152 family protein [Bryobacteraceae bacterium]